MTDRKLMQMALDALENYAPKVGGAAIEALRARLAQPEPKPWGYISHKAWKMPVFVEADDLQAANLPHNNPDYTPVYKTAPQREWVGLTDEEMFSMWVKCPAETEDRYAFARAIEAKLKEKNT